MRPLPALVALLWTLLAGAAAPAMAAPPPVVPEPTFDSVSQEVLVEMDDGVRLAATVVLPSRDGATPAEGRFPVVLAMTPYGRNGLCGCTPPDFWATRGMAGVVVDVRGTGGSGGDLDGNYFSPREQRDGAALIEHFGRQPWSTGKVGMVGGSYVRTVRSTASAPRGCGRTTRTPTRSRSSPAAFTTTRSRSGRRRTSSRPATGCSCD